MLHDQSTTGLHRQSNDALGSFQTEFPVNYCITRVTDIATAVCPHTHLPPPDTHTPDKSVEHRLHRVTLTPRNLNRKRKCAD